MGHHRLGGSATAKNLQLIVLLSRWTKSSNLQKTHYVEPPHPQISMFQRTLKTKSDELFWALISFVHWGFFALQVTLTYINNLGAFWGTGYFWGCFIFRPGLRFLSFEPASTQI